MMLMNPAPAIDIGVALTAALTMASRRRRSDFSISNIALPRWLPWLLLMLLAVLTVIFVPAYPEILAWTASEGFTIPN
jgi:hypothetical protein